MEDDKEMIEDLEKELADERRRLSHANRAPQVSNFREWLLKRPYTLWHATQVKENFSEFDISKCSVGEYGSGAYFCNSISECWHAKGVSPNTHRLVECDFDDAPDAGGRSASIGLVFGHTGEYISEPISFSEPLRHGDWPVDRDRSSEARNWRFGSNPPQDWSWDMLIVLPIYSPPLPSTHFPERSPHVQVIVYRTAFHRLKIRNWHGHLPKESNKE